MLAYSMPDFRQRLSSTPADVPSARPRTMIRRLARWLTTHGMADRTRATTAQPVIGSYATRHQIFFTAPGSAG